MTLRRGRGGAGKSRDLIARADRGISGLRRIRGGAAILWLATSAACVCFRTGYGVGGESHVR